MVLGVNLLYLQAGEITVVQVPLQLNGCKDMNLKNLKFEGDELRDMVKQLMVSLNFQPMPYTRDQVDEDDVVDDNEDVVDNNDDESE
ncbi:hypothetical protein QL285_065641 [Trifolium repens]|jgi:hypothetical protein|nr:hypothetical protein QL285_065641 [Trifolium repens]